MILQELLVLLPCHSLEDFPQHYEGDEADGLLAAWTALWHPELLVAAGRGPTWYRADDPPEQLDGRLILVPAVSANLLPSGFLQRADAADCCLILGESDRPAILERALSACGEGSQIDADWVADFLALGYCFLQSQLLTRQMRYSSNLDETHFFNQAVEAAQSAHDGDHESMRARLTACFDSLSEERDHYYSVDAYLLDITMVSASTLGQGLRRELAGQEARNLLISGAVLEQLGRDQPETLAALRAGISENLVGLIGGEYQERPLPLESLEAMLEQLQRGQACYQSWLDRDVRVYGRFRFGLNPLLPQVLERLGYIGALHTSFEQGRCPEGTQAKTQWEGCDGSFIDTIAKPPTDAAKSSTFLRLAQQLGESMDMDHVATICLAHWPGQSSPWYQDLLRCTHYGAALGKMVTIEEFFGETYAPGHRDRFSADQYRSPYLRQSQVQKTPDPLSETALHWQADAARQTRCGMAMLLAAVSGSDLTATDPSDEVESTAPDTQTLAEQFSTALPRRDEAERGGLLVVNPLNFPRRVPVDVSRLASLPQVGRPIYAAAASDSRSWAMVDVPSMGFVWLAANESAGGAAADNVRLVEDRRQRDGLVALRNEYFEALIDPTTGALKAFKDYNARQSRLGQQLALRRERRPDRNRAHGADLNESADYSVMAADEIEITSATSVLGEVSVRGRLLDRDGQILARYDQQFRIWRGRRVLEIDVQLDPKVELEVDPWKEYFACRFAWPDETAQFSSSLLGTSQAREARRCESPLFYELSAGDQRTSIFPTGLPYARRTGYRMLDTLLIVPHESQRRFRLGIGVDVANPAHEALHLLAPPLVVTQQPAPPQPANSGWFFHFDSRCVMATWWQPVVDNGRVVGAEFRLLETHGRPARTRVSCFRPLQSAVRVDFRGASLGACPIDQGRALLELTAHEWSQFEIRWE